MNKLRKNIILVLIVSLILSVNYAAFAESSESKDLALNMDEVTEEKTTETIATNDATEQDENKDESEEKVITVDEQTEKDQLDENEAIDESETELQEDTEVEIEQEKSESNKKDKETKEPDEKSDIKEKDEDKLEGNLNKETEKTEKTQKPESKNTKNLDGEQDVTNWSEFKAAYESKEVHTINLENDIVLKNASEASLENRGTSLTIEGNGKTLDTGLNGSSELFTLANTASTSPTQTFKINDLKIKHSKGKVFESEDRNCKWKLDLNNIQNVDTKPALSFGPGIDEIKLSGEKFNWESDTYFIQNVNAEVFIENVQGEENRIITNGTAILAKKLKIDNSNLAITNTVENNAGDQKSAIILHLKSLEKDYSSGIEINNSTVDMKSSVHNDSKRSAAVVIGDDGSNFGQPVHFRANNSIININSKTNTIPDKADAIILFRGKGNVGISNGSKVNLTSEDAGKVIFADSSGGFDIEVSGENTELNLKQNYLDRNRQPVLKYSKSTKNGNKVKSTDGAEINIISAKQGTTETVSLVGGNNDFSAERGGNIRIINPSNEKNENPRVNTNQAIMIAGGGNLDPNKFSSINEGSEFIIESKQGKAIEDCSFTKPGEEGQIRDLQLSVTERASFIARGNVTNVTGTPWTAIVNGVISGTKLSVKVENAKFYDFANTVEGGGSVFNPSKSKDSIYKSSGTGLNLWELGKDIDGKPDNSWNAIDFTFEGRNFGILKIPDENEGKPSNIAQHKELVKYMDKKSGLVSFSRISNMSAADILKIDANDLFISRKDFQKITNVSDLEKAMDAKILVQNEPSTTYKISTNHGDLDFESPKLEHSYNITFSIVGYKDIKVTKKLVILDYDHVTQSNEYVVAANDFSIWDHEAAVITNVDILKRSDAKGWAIEDWPNTIKQVEVSKHNVEGVARDEPYNATIKIKEKE